MRVVGVDVGGTSIRAGLVEDLRVKRKVALPTETERGFEKSFRNLCEVIQRILTPEIEGLGVACAGIVTKEGEVVFSPNLLGWGNIPLRSELERRFGFEVRVINDVDAMLLAELKLGAARGCENAICLALGTGVGGAIVVEGKLYLGSRGFAGELGHVSINLKGPRCRCGNRGCLEEYVGSRGFLRVLRRLAKGHETRLDVKRATPEQIVALALEGDDLCARVVGEVAHYLGVGLANLANTFDPELIVIGGGISKAGPLLLEPAKRVMEELSMVKGVKVTQSELGEDAGILGAALLFEVRLP